MSKYTNFLNTTGIYWDILELDSTIQIYQDMMENNETDKIVYERLRITMESYKQERKAILGKNRSEDIKEEILSVQDVILGFLLKSNKELETLYCSKHGNRKLPLYALLLELVKYDIAFFEFYRVLIENHLYNPNLEYGVSDEPFYTMLPTEPLNRFYSLNQLVISNPKTDFHILRNGSDVMEYVLYYLSNSENEFTKKYWEEYIMTAIKGSCSLLDSRRYHGVLAYEVKPSIFSIMDHPELERIQEYLLSEQGVDKQIENAIYPSLERDKAITFYMERISDSNIRNRLYQKKYQK